MPSDIVADDVVKAHIVSEYGQALASVAERFLRYPDRMSSARSDNERRAIDAYYAGILSRLISSYPVALAALYNQPKTKGINMPNWLKKVLHALVPAAGAALAAAVPALGIPVVAKVAIGAAVGYLVKPARPAADK